MNLNLNFKSTFSKIKEKPNFQLYWFVFITVLGLLLSQLLDKYMGKASESSLGNGISLAEVIIAITIVITSIISIISIAVANNNYMTRAQIAHENCMTHVLDAHENCKSRAKDAHQSCESYLRNQKKPIVKYKEEIRSDVSDEKWTGYNDISYYIEKAKSRILQVTSSQNSNLEETVFKSRDNYFDVLNKKISQNKSNPKFEYTRIHQVSNESEPLHLRDETTKEFYNKVLEIKRDKRTHATIDLHKVKNNRSYGFTIIDDKYLIVQMSGFGQKGSVSSGVFIFEDNDPDSEDSLIRYFEKYYHDVKADESLCQIKSFEVN
jgi:hypothetical protein